MLRICYTCKSMRCGKNCQPETCDYRFICIKSAKIDFCATCQVLHMEYFEEQFRKRLLPKKIRWEKEEEDGS